MNVIIAYLETMFGAYPASPRMSEARAELQAMMEDAYAASIADGLSENEAVGKVITEFGNLDELAPVLGISREIHPQDQATGQVAPPAATATGLPGSAKPGAAGARPSGYSQPPAQPLPTPPSPAYPPLPLAEAKAYAQLRQETAPRLGSAVALFVCGPALLVALTTLWPSGEQRIGSFVGIIALLFCVAVGVLLLVGRSQQLKAFARIERGQFSVSPEVTSWANALSQQYARNRNGRLQAAIGLWILAIIPVMSTIVLPSGWSGAAVAMSLLIVAAGLLVFLPANWAEETAGVLTQRTGAAATGGFGAADGDDERSVVGVIASFYWPIVTLGYLAWSFLWDAWGDSWIIWPIAGVLFGVIAAGFGSLESYRKARR